MFDDPTGAANAVRFRQFTPCGAFFGVDAAGPPDSGPENLRVSGFRFSQCRLERFRQTLVRIDTYPELRLTINRLEPRFEPQREEQNRMTIGQLAKRVLRAGKLVKGLPQARTTRIE